MQRNLSYKKDLKVTLFIHYESELVYTHHLTMYVCIKFKDVAIAINQKYWKN